MWRMVWLMVFFYNLRFTFHLGQGGYVIPTVCGAATSVCWTKLYTKLANKKTTKRKGAELENAIETAMGVVQLIA